MKFPQQAPAAPQDEPWAAIAAMVTKLEAMRDRQQGETLRGSYKAAIDRLEALVYRLSQATG